MGETEIDDNIHIHTTLWSPDTCECQIEFDWDDRLPAEERVHTASRYVNICETHKDLQHHTVGTLISANNKLKAKPHSELYDTVLGENQRKNILHGHVLETFPELTNHSKPEIQALMAKNPEKLTVMGIEIEKEKEEEPPAKQLLEGIEYIWSYEGTGKDRVLKASIKGVKLHENHKKALKDLADSSFGNGKVIVE